MKKILCIAVITALLILLVGCDDKSTTTWLPIRMPNGTVTLLPF